MEKKDNNGSEGKGQDRTRQRRWKRRTVMGQREQERIEQDIGDGKEGQQWSRGSRRG